MSEFSDILYDLINQEADNTGSTPDNILRQFQSRLDAEDEEKRRLDRLKQEKEEREERERERERNRTQVDQREFRVLPVSTIYDDDIPTPPGFQFGRENKKIKMNKIELKKENKKIKKNKIELKKKNKRMNIKSPTSTRFGKTNKIELKRLQKKAKKMRIRITKDVKGTRVYKTIKELKTDIKKRMKKKNKN